MTTATIKSVSSKTRTKAAEKASKFNENVAVFEATIGTSTMEIIVLVSEWESSEIPENVEFLAVIDSDGNYVD